MKDTPAVRIATLIEQLNTQVNLHIEHMIKLKKKDPKIDLPKKKKIDPDVQFHFVRCQVTFLNERGLILMMNPSDFSPKKDQVKEMKDPVFTKKGSVFNQNPSIYILCNFDIDLLPVKLHLPMVCKPIPWAPVQPGKQPKSLYDLYGGYLHPPYGDFHRRYKLLTSHDIEHFHILFEKKSKYLIQNINKLQSQAFEINI